MIRILKNILHVKNSKNINNIENKLEQTFHKTEQLKKITNQYIESQKLLEIERNKLKIMFHKANVCKIIINKDFNIEDINEYGCKLFDIKYDNIINQSIFNIVCKDDDEKFKLQIKNVINKSQYKKRNIIRFMCSNNKELILESSIYLINDDYNDLILYIQLDELTKEQLLETIIEEKNRFIKKIILTHPGILYVNNIIDNRNIWFNNEVINVIGYKKEELIKFDKDFLKKILNADDYKYYIDEIYPKYKLLKDDEILQTEYRIKLKSGIEKWFKVIETPFNREEDGNLKEILGVMIDIDDIKNNEELLKLNTRILKNAKDSIIITDRNGNIIFVNDKFCNTTGYNVTDVINKNPRILKSGKHEDNFYKEMWETISNGKTWNGKVINKNKDGELFVEETTITPVANGEIQYYIAIKTKIGE